MNSIVNFPESTSLAVHAMLLMSRNYGRDKFLTTREMASSIGASGTHLSKVLQQLVRMGLVESNRGPGGGYRLARHPEEISMREIFEAIGGPISSQGCGLKKCRMENCFISAFVDQTTAALRNYLSGKTLSDLMTNCKKTPRVSFDISIEE